MNLKNRVNEHLLGKRIEAIGITDFCDRTTIQEFNAGKGYRNTKFTAAVTAGCAILTVFLALFEAPLQAVLVLGGIGLFCCVSTLVAYRRERKLKLVFERVALQIEKDEWVVAAVFRGYADFKRHTARKVMGYDVHTFFYDIDWTRSEVLKLVIQIENGNESMRGELRIKFDVAKKLFGKDFDCDIGFDFFFSRRVTQLMKNFKMEFEPILIR